jgi:triphosphoribosyl-dephospho-CoA synthase
LSGRGKPQAIARAFHDACLAELEALKPGNVHRFADDTRMTVADFVKSAEAASPIIGRAGLRVGERIRLAVEATQDAVGQNTNLGIVLLCAPLAAAALGAKGGDLHDRLARVLNNLTVEDAREAYAAIRAAKPGGLGQAPEHDVASEPQVTLLEAMRAAETRDRIAWNYTNGFVDIFGLGLRRLAQARSHWGEGPWPITYVYLGFLAQIPDSLIERKRGAKAAVELLEEASPIEASLGQATQPEAMEAPLLAFDRSLKERGLNPGTSADLTVATLFAAALEDMERAE